MTINFKEFQEQGRKEVVKKDSKLKKYIVKYVGDKYAHLSNTNEVTIEMIINALANEFPELLLVVGEENYLRGYEQALNDVEIMTKKESETNE